MIRASPRSIISIINNKLLLDSYFQNFDIQQNPQSITAMDVCAHSFDAEITQVQVGAIIMVD